VQTPRYLAFVPHARMRWLPGLSHVPISDNPEGVASLMLRFLASTDDRVVSPS
jgi:pimeloyl-ACP methyl ester carboxylesterase